jgi:hypothetical protein
MGTDDFQRARNVHQSLKAVPRVRALDAHEGQLVKVNLSLGELAVPIDVL